MLEYAPIVRGISREFFWPGADREDVQQEAWLALIEAKPENRALASVVIRRRLIDRLRYHDHRPQFAAEVDTADSETVHDIVERREMLRLILAVDLTDLERVALGRVIREEPLTSKSDDNARQRARARLRAAA